MLGGLDAERMKEAAANSPPRSLSSLSPFLFACAVYNHEWIPDSGPSTLLTDCF